MTTTNIILKHWWTARYGRDSTSILDDFNNVAISDKEKSSFFLNSILNTAQNPQLKTVDPRFPDYQLPKALLAANAKIRKIIVDETQELLQKPNLKWEETKEFLTNNHEQLKRLQNRWFAANPGLLLEWVKITDSYPKKLIDWLKDQKVAVGDDVIHLHVISNRGRQRLKAMGFDVPRDHWHESYYRDMLSKCAEIMKMNPKVRGLFCDSSWVHNPFNFQTAPDGKPFVSFTFLENKLLTGETIDITDCLSQRDYQSQVEFAVRSPRRKQYLASRVYQVRAIASFYDRDRLINCQTKSQF